MEIKATNTASSHIKSVVKLQNLLLKFEDSLFKAIVSHKINNDTFLLNSKAGAFQITSPLKLLKGDELILQVKPATQQTPASLEVSRIIRPNALQGSKTFPEETYLAQKKLTLQSPNTLQLIPKSQQHFIAKIIANDQQSIHLKSLKGDLFSLPKSDFKSTSFTLKNNEYVMLKWIQPNKVELQSISKEQLLHQAQRQLLSRQDQTTNTFQRLSQAASRLFQAIKHELPLVNKVPAQTPPTLSTQVQQQDHAPLTQSVKITAVTDVIKHNTPFTQSQHTQKEFQLPARQQATNKNTQQLSNTPHITQIKHIQQGLQTLLKSLPLNTKTLNPEHIQKLFIELNIINKPAKAGEMPLLWLQKLNIIKQEIDDLLETPVTSKTQKQTGEPDDIISEFLKMVLKETKQSIEATLHKLLLQNTTTKLNQDVNNTQLINSQIPFELDKQTRDVTLKIKQHKNHANETTDAWEIHLSFEFAVLGFISTKIMLKDNHEVSVLFWAELTKTKQLLEEKKHIFQQQMKMAGFNLANLSVFLGTHSEDIMPINISQKKFIDINV